MTWAVAAVIGVLTVICAGLWGVILSGLSR
jgi:hypothetical protein